ncbi:hypothetical protein LINPERPRIM_LOCUS32618 [Linum perenne]
MASSSSSPPSSSSWASIVADKKSDLEFVLESRKAVVDGILHIPKEVVDLGVAKLRSAIVAQFLGEVPPVKVIRGVLNRLWGYEGEIILSTLSVGFFLVELPSVKLCDWILARSWHIHHSAMILRRWAPQITPIDFTQKEVPTWIVLKAVPPTLVTPKGISWLASQVGQPVSKFIRDELDVKVCIIRKVDEEVKPKLEVVLAGGEQCSIDVEYPEPRSYSWKTTHVGAVGKDAASQSFVYVPKGTSSGNATEPLVGEGAPENSPKEQNGGGTGNGSKAPFGVEVPLVQQATSSSIPKRVHETKDGVLVSDSEDNEEIEVEKAPEQRASVWKQAEACEQSVSASTSQGLNIVLGENGAQNLQKPTFVDFMNQSKLVSPKGVITRPKNRRR